LTDSKIESKWQKRWQEKKLFQSNPDNREKLFLTVAYPYPSGAMHVGHGRTYTVPDVYARYKRMQGYNVLFPMGWHVTGAPVIGIAKRIGRRDPWTLDIYQNVHKVPQDELEKFTDPHYIVKYFSEEYRNVMTQLGYSIDWRREFTTIDPHYQKFITWQFEKLNQKGLVRRGAHPVKYCPDDENPVGDHDLLEGEGVAINELTLIKFKIGKNYMVAATFRPETLFGATNIWINPDEEYVKVKMDEEEWIISNKAYHNLLNQKNNLELVQDIDAPSLIGQYAENPVTGKKHIILPASFVDPDYATGVVYSVPAHAPADYIALLDLKKDSETLEQYNIKDEVETIKPIGLISLKGFGEHPAAEMVEKMGVKDQNDPKLKEATNEMYKLEHAKGVMEKHITDYAGLKVPQARDAIKEHLLETDKGDIMHEFAEKPVICRCGTECVVKILDNQWFLKYSDEEWTQKTLKCLESMNTVPGEIRSNFKYYLNWLHDWACARRIGLGTPLPWDPQWLIEPLSDSTIYMGYYTIAPYLKDIDPEEMDEEFLDHIFLDKKTSKTNIPPGMKEEFNYWYPLDWRLSAKDLVGNHLSFHLFHHSAIYPHEKWPQGVVVFGMGLMEGHKMSSSKGNIVLLEDAIKIHGADVVRLFLMSSAEPWQDFDWREKEVIGTKKRLEWFMGFAEMVDELHGSQIQLNDCIEAPDVSKSINSWMISQVNQRVRDATHALEGFQTRKALQEALFLLKKDIDHYLHRVDHELKEGNGKEEINQVLAYVLGIWIRLMAPFTPHACEELWDRHGGRGFASEAPWPEHDMDLIDEMVHKSEEIIQGLVDDIREIEKITKTSPEKIHAYLAPQWKWKVFEIAREVGKPDIGRIMGQAIKENIHDDKKELAGYAQKIAREMTKIHYVGHVDEKQILDDAVDYIARETGAEVIIYQEPTYDPKNKARNALPYKPALYIE
jgi:leucyl-tRNA synthetase